MPDFVRLVWFILAAWAFYALLVVLSSEARRRLSNYYVFVSIPSVFVTLGILGTFSGIVQGLYGFDVNDISGSLPAMIAGLKTKFWTSIAGILASLVFKPIVATYVSQGKVKEPATEESLALRRLEGSMTAIQELLAKQVGEHGQLRGDQKAAHMELVRVINRNGEETRSQIDEVTQSLAQANSEALVGALQDVITDFNQTFSMFIGQLVEKNFDKLTDAVDQLVEWQRTYREDIQIIRASYQQMLVKFEDMVEHGERWVDVMDSIAGQGAALQQVVDEFNLAFSDSSRFRETLQRIHDATTELKQGATHLKDLGSRFDEAGKAFNRAQDTVAEWSKSASSVSSMVSDLQGTLVQLRQFDIAQITKLDESFIKRLEDTMRSFDDLVGKYITYLENRR